jgi:hypothetical protein
MPEMDEFGGEDEQQLRDLDFEGNMDEPDPKPAAPPQAQQPRQPEREQFREDEYEELDPYEAAAAQQEAIAWLQELAEEDPLQAADVMAQLRTEQAMGQLEQRLAPVFAKHGQDEAHGELEQLRATFGADVVQEHGPATADVIARNRDYFLDPATRGERLAQVLKALEFDKIAYENSPAAARDRDAAAQDQVRAEIDAEIGSQDTFGTGARARDASGRFVGRIRHTAHVEGGSEGQPRLRQPNVDPVIAEIDEYSKNTRGDVFGRAPGSNR